MRATPRRRLREDQPSLSCRHRRSFGQSRRAQSAAESAEHKMCPARSSSPCRDGPAHAFLPGQCRKGTPALPISVELKRCALISSLIRRIRVSRWQTDRCARSPLIKKGVWRDFATPRSQQPPGSFITSGKNLSLTGIIRLALGHFLAVLCPFSRLDKSRRSLSSSAPAGTGRSCSAFACSARPGAYRQARATRPLMSLGPPATF